MERIILLFLVLTSNFSIAQTSKSYTFNFALNKVKPISTSFSTLDSTITILQKQYKIISIQIDAHTDSKGSEKYNIKLSGERAQYIYEQIINSGFEESKINKNAWGESKPLFSNKKLSHKNRRVEIVFLLEEKSKKVENPVIKNIVESEEKIPSPKSNKITSKTGIYAISNSQDTNILVLQDAFFFEILPNTFLNDSVVIEIEDYLSSKSIIENNISTTSGSSFLVSKGMFKICFSEETLKPIKIKVPCSLKGMQIYETAEIEYPDWKLESQATIQTDPDTGDCFDVIPAGETCKIRNYDIEPVLIFAKVKRKYWKGGFTYCFDESENTISIGQKLFKQKHPLFRKHIFGVRELPANDSLKVIFAKKIDNQLVTTSYLFLVKRARFKKKKGLEYFKFVRKGSLFKKKEIENPEQEKIKLLEAPLYEFSL
ncbi:MAG: hypothetical protein ACJAWV_002849 [Flammeovirgaceae bacterium]|jgi:hypothetical protein